MTWSACFDLQLGSRRLAVELDGDHPTVALIGPNGAGKSTILRAIAGDVRPANGSITIGARRVFDSDRNVDLDPRHRGLGYVPQGFALFPHLTVAQNVAFALPDASRAEATLEALELRTLADRKPASLSGGEAQRVALARALARPSELLLLDEPMAALDVGARKAVRGRLAAVLSEQASATLLVSHDRRDILALADFVYVIEGSGISDSGPPREVAARAQTPFIEEYFE